MKRNLCLAAGMLLLFSVFTPGESFSQCPGGIPYSTLEYRDTFSTNSVNNAGDVVNFSFPQFPLIGTLHNINFTGMVTLANYSYSIENQTNNSGQFAVGISKQDEVFSSAFPPAFELFGTRNRNLPSFTLAPTDGVMNSGLDYRSETDMAIWSNNTVFNSSLNYGLASFTGNGNVDFEYNSNVYQILQLPFQAVVTISGEVRTIFRMIYEYCPNAPLSHDFISFNARKTGDGNNYELGWQANNELPGTKYRIMVSSNGSQYQTLQVINGKAAEANEKQVYNFSGVRNLSGNRVLYFKVLKEEPGGEKLYSSTQSLTWDADFSAGVRIFPNPAHDLISLDFGKSKETDWQVSIVGLDGKVLQQTAVKTTNGQTNFNIGPGIAKGFYILKAYSKKDQTSVSTKLFVDR